MLQRNELHRPKLAGIMAGVAVVVAGATLAAVVPAQTWSQLRQHNLIALIGHLTTTTNGLYDNTVLLSHRVDQVKGELSQLNTQTQLLQQQVATGQALTSALGQQETLTAQGVEKMQQILQKQQETESITRQVGEAADSAATTVAANADALTSMEHALSSADGTARHMNSLFDQLLVELGKAEDEFKLFGQVDHLLGGSSSTGSGGLLGGGTGLLGGSSSPGSSSLGNSGTPGNGTSGSGTSGSSNTSSSNSVGGLLGGGLLPPLSTLP